MTHGLRISWIAFSCLVFAGCQPPPHLSVEILDSNAHATDATHLRFGVDRGSDTQFETVTLNGQGFPFSVVLTRNSGSEAIDILVGAGVVTESGMNVLARGRADGVELLASRRGSVTIELASACEDERSEGLECVLDGVSERTICVNQICAPSSCGDGYADTRGTEACDDGNSDEFDDCLSTCELARCGDGFLRADLSPGDPNFEECDDSNSIDGDACTNDCNQARCGDGVRRTEQGDDPAEVLEQCDDGNANPNDACLTSCVEASCGDGVVRTDIQETSDPAFESCDDGNTSAIDGCDSQCRQVDWMASVVAGEGRPVFDGSLARGSAVARCDIPGACTGMLIADIDSNRIILFDDEADRGPPEPRVLVGTGGSGWSEGQPALQSLLNKPTDIAVATRTEQVFIAHGSCVQSYSFVSNRVSAVLGQCDRAGDDPSQIANVPGTDVLLSRPTALAYYADLNERKLFVADMPTRSVWELNLSDGMNYGMARRLLGSPSDPSYSLADIGQTFSYGTRLRGPVGLDYDPATKRLFVFDQMQSYDSVDLGDGDDPTQPRDPPFDYGGRSVGDDDDDSGGAVVPITPGRMSLGAPGSAVDPTIPLGGGSKGSSVITGALHTHLAVVDVRDSSYTITKIGVDGEPIACPEFTCLSYFDRSARDDPKHIVLAGDNRPVSAQNPATDVFIADPYRSTLWRFPVSESTRDELTALPQSASYETPAALELHAGSAPSLYVIDSARRLGATDTEGAFSTFAIELPPGAVGSLEPIALLDATVVSPVASARALSLSLHTSEGFSAGLVVDRTFNRVVRIESDGSVTPVFGGGDSCSVDRASDNPCPDVFSALAVSSALPVLSALENSNGIVFVRAGLGLFAVGSDGNAYRLDLFADGEFPALRAIDNDWIYIEHESAIYRVDTLNLDVMNPSSVASLSAERVAGTPGEKCLDAEGPCGLAGGTAALDAKLFILDFDVSDDLLVISAGSRVYGVDLAVPQPTIGRIAGADDACADVDPCSVDESDPLAIPLLSVSSVAVGPGRVVYLADGSLIRRLAPSDAVYVADAVAGLATEGVVEGMDPALAPMGSIERLRVADDALWVLTRSSGEDRVLRSLPLDGTGLPVAPVTTLAGPIHFGDGRLDESQFALPTDILCLDLTGPTVTSARTAGASCLVADESARRLRRIDWEFGFVDSVLGIPNGSTETAPARVIDEPDAPRALSRLGDSLLLLDGAGELFVTDLSTTDWTTTRRALDFDEFDGRALATHPISGAVVVSEHRTDRVYLVNVETGAIDPVVNTIGGSGIASNLGSRTAGQVPLNNPTGLAFAPYGSLYVADTANHQVLRVRPGADGRVTVDSQIERVLGVPGSDNSPSISEGRLDAIDQAFFAPEGLTVDDEGNLFVAGGGVIAVVAAGADGIASGSDPVRPVFDARDFPDDSLLGELSCLAGSSMGGESQTLYVVDRCRGYVVELSNESL